MKYGNTVSPLDYSDSSGRFLRGKFRRDLLDTFRNKSRAARYLNCDRRTVTRWFDDEHPHDPCRLLVDQFCRYRAKKLMVDRFMPRPPK